MWYIVEAKNNAKILLGLREGIDKNILKKAIDNNINNIESLFNYFEVKKRRRLLYSKRMRSVQYWEI